MFDPLIQNARSIISQFNLNWGLEPDRVYDAPAKNELEYSNAISDLVYNLSNNGTKVTRKLIKALFKKLSYLVED